MKSKKNEKVIIGLACGLTVVIVLGFTLMQGTIKSKEKKYTSKESNIKTESTISKDDYKIINQEEKDGIQKFVVLEKKKFNTEEISVLTNNIIKDTNKKFEIYLFDNEEKAKNFNYKKEETQTTIKPIDKDKIEIQNYYIVKEETNNAPQYYSVESIKEANGLTKIELNIESTEKPKKALGEMKFLGQSIKDLNKEKNLENLEIKAYCKDEKDPKWVYTSENKNLIIHNETTEL